MLNVRNLLGETVLEVASDQLLTRVDLHAAAGVYFFTVICGNGIVKSGKLISLNR